MGETEIGNHFYLANFNRLRKWLNWKCGQSINAKQKTKNKDQKKNLKKNLETIRVENL